MILKKCCNTVELDILSKQLYNVLYGKEDTKLILNPVAEFPPDEVNHVQGAC